MIHWQLKKLKIDCRNQKSRAVNGGIQILMSWTWSFGAVWRWHDSCTQQRNDVTLEQWKCSWLDLALDQLWNSFCGKRVIVGSVGRKVWRKKDESMALLHPFFYLKLFSNVFQRATLNQWCVLLSKFNWDLLEALKRSNQTYKSKHMSTSQLHKVKLHISHLVLIIGCYFTILSVLCLFCLELLTGRSANRTGWFQLEHLKCNERFGVEFNWSL